MRHTSAQSSLSGFLVLAQPIYGKRDVGASEANVNSDANTAAAKGAVTHNICVVIRKCLNWRLSRVSSAPNLLCFDWCYLSGNATIDREEI